ncbi:tRNA guanosine(34) transglycosylase Tgt [Candidatus Nitronereus thalassa]|uniref:Queuine tRNA-ribosyltransferase n=1 Tax=Candidatus Nitronereus thalassa TaxID=3020898 RepID=A0ABU3KCH6_9BACT|nr:tRNA guanosine(34) transglycosylase Tgt [Candidatus Nitronereus thalassa]MDT7044164.1 tRNA guanosine(34) transglycosylase Tgt [Candidatus Nitronereus thalassa]
MIQFSTSYKETACQARTGQLTTPHGIIETPVFMPVGTLGPVKGITPDELKSCGFGLMLSNSYHLYLRPGHELIAELGGLHRFASWSGAILTDSGGFQMVSLSDLRHISDEGVTFKSHLDGSLHQLTPERCIEIQRALGSDIMMVLDECPTHPCTTEQAREAVRRSRHWARQCKVAAEGSGQALFGIVQGGLDADLRRTAAQDLVAMGFDGYALGGLSLGEDKLAMLTMIEVTIPELPEDHPRYLMGVGLPEDLVEGVIRGIDMFDCVMPSRHGRTGWLFTSTGRVMIKNAQYMRDESPIDAQCACPVCQKYSRAYLRHLFVSNEMLGVRLNTLHNLWYYQQLMKHMREAIQQDRLLAFREQFYATREASPRSRAYLDEIDVGVVDRNGRSRKEQVL